MQSEENEARKWASLCHFAALIGYVVPFGHLVGPIVVWTIKGKEYPFADEQGREAVNFQITMTLYYVLVVILCFVFIGFLLLPFLGIFGLVFTIIAGIKARDGISYRYPLTIRLLN